MISVIKPFNVVKSLVGHDEGELYVVCQVEGKFVYLVNGKNRPLNKPKKKNIRHVKKVVTLSSQRVLQKLTEYAKLENSHIIYALKQIKGEVDV